MSSLTHNKWGAPRMCSRCPSKEPVVIRVKSEYLCQACKEKRIERQRKERMRPKRYCRCGRQLGRDCELCDFCQMIQDERDQIDAIESLDELKEYLKEKL